MTSAGPAEALEQVVKLRNGAAVRLRPIQPDDAPRLMALCQRLTPRTVYQRFFSIRRLRPEEAHAFANVDYRRRMAAVVAEVDVEGEPQLRLGRPDDIAQAVLYLASDDAAWTTGTIVTVDGGIMAQ